MVLVPEDGDELDNLSCLLCNIELAFNLSDHSVYKSHLRGQHKVTSYDLDKLVYLTLNQNYPQLCRSYENLFGLNSTGIQCCLEPDLQFRNDSSLSEEVGGDSGFFDNFDNNSEISRKRSLSSTFDNNSETSRKRSLSSTSSRHESESKRSRVAETNSEQSEFFPEKTCSNCGQVFEEIFQCQSHLISCLNIKQRRSVGQKKSNVESQLTETTSTKVQNKQKLKVPSSVNDKSLPNLQNSRLKENAGNPTKENVGKSPKKNPGRLIVDECQFRCKMCSKVMTMKSRYKHMERKHATTYTQYAVKYGDTTRPKYHLCVICKMKICWVPSNISSHLSSNHSMALESYVSQYREEITAQKAELKDKLLVKCEECGKAFTGIQRLRRHTRRDHTKSQKEENMSQEKLKSNVSGTSLGFPSRVEERIKIHEDWWERYTRQCGKCGLYYETKSDLVHHIKQDHGIKVVEYTVEHGTVRKHCSFRCEICKQEIKWSVDKIRNHLDSVHYLTLKDYGDRYVNAGTCSKSNSEEKLRKVEVNISKLDPKNLAQLKVQDENENMEVKEEDDHDNDNDSNEDEDSVWDYSCLPKQDLGKCVNSVIEDLFKDPSITNFSSPTRPREEELFDLPYKCATCGFRSRSKHLLKTHIQELHTKMTAIHCCGQAYTTQWNYQVHLESEQHHQTGSDHHNLIVPEDVVLPADKFAAESALSVIVGDPQQDHHTLDLIDSRSSTPHPLFSSSTQDVILADVEAGQSSHHHQHPLQQPTTSSSKKRFGHYSKIKTIKVLYTEGKSDCSDIVHNKRKVLETVGDLVDDQAAADDLVEDLDQDDQGQTMIDPPSEKSNYQNICDTTCQLDKYGRGRSVPRTSEDGRGRSGPSCSDDGRGRSGPSCGDDGRGRSVPNNNDDGRGRSGPSTSDDEEAVDMDEMETSEMDTSTEDSVDAMTELREAKEYKIWANQCTMRCEHKDCGFLTHDLIDFRMHTLSVHSQLFEQYQQFIQPNSGSKAKPGTSQGKIWTNLVNVTCELCSTKIVHSQEKIESHMLDTHFITGFQYFKIYIKPFLVVKAELEALREKKGTPPGKNVRKSSQILKELSFN